MTSKFYRSGSEGTVNLFFRPEGMDYTFHGDCGMHPASAEKSQWVIQWDGSPEYDSGYMAYQYADEAAARVAFSEMEAEENARR